MIKTHLIAYLFLNFLFCRTDERGDSASDWVKMELPKDTTEYVLTGLLPYTVYDISVKPTFVDTTNK